MQTFLPYASFEKSADILDFRRKGNQRVEVLQILGAIFNVRVKYPPSPLNVFNKPIGWKNHPATNMWRGYEKALAHYLRVFCESWKSHGYKDTRLDALNYYFPDLLKGEYELPPWFGREDFHSRHRAALLAKNYKYYRQFGWTEEPKIDYLWG